MTTWQQRVNRGRQLPARPRPGRATRSTCNTCDAPVLVGLEDGIGPGVAITDQKALTPLGEFQALTHGADTWAHNAHTQILERRRPEQITQWPAGTVRHQPVYADHECGNEYDHKPTPSARKEYNGLIPY